jgi:opacity protein-like surface antigen
VRDTVGLFNLYWDFTERGTRFVPYIGAGIGFAVRTIDRWHQSTETLTDETVVPPAPISRPSLSGKNKAHQAAVAAAAQAGFAYTLDQGMVLDFSYRFAYIGGVDAAMPINGVSSRLSIGDTFEHALRAGIRWNVW